ncbi:MAG TPA: hypothetical protein VE732_05250 [Nitrososphaera sp.]|jgi:hypothetical protein|nr:hypothetical protein [Nitrososphaera sp.]
MKITRRPFIKTVLVVYETANPRMANRLWHLHHRQSELEDELRAYKYGFWLLLGLFIILAFTQM